MAIASDVEIAQGAKLRPIVEIAEELGLGADEIELYGAHKAKVSLDALTRREGEPDGKLILVTAMTPTPLGEGKTLTTVGLGQSLARLGKKSILCVREPSLGPVFGIKGGAAGGGMSQVLPMEDINSTSRATSTRSPPPTTCSPLSWTRTYSTATNLG